MLLYCAARGKHGYADRGTTVGDLLRKFRGRLAREGAARNRRKINLQQQPFEILATLLERPGEVVTREQLRERLWSGDTFVDFDHGINSAIRRLRDALGDSAENSRFVQTLGRRGSAWPFRRQS